MPKGTALTTEPNSFHPPDHVSHEKSAPRKLSLPKWYWGVLSALFLTSFAPLVLLRIYISATGDYAARWAVVSYGPILLVTIPAFIIVLLLGIVRAALNSARRGQKSS